ncbi:major allergen Pru ar 1-like [Senna tora]|uniref:Major allergen Pru ar 1-like n=1 Tax=Senna tora TaxID=362788 RepID=A0A834W7U5_9FABA|nr:major allergen Pru ar 1-like [Senna tora]
MAALTLTSEFSSPVQAKRLFEALIVDADNLMPKLMPQAIKSIELVQGNGGPGSIKKMTIAQGTNMRELKHRIDAIDKENLTYSYSLIEGDDEVLKKAESVSHEIKLEATPEGGSKGKNVSKYHPKQGLEITEEDVKAGREAAMGALKLVEAYLQENPQAYA